MLLIISSLQNKRYIQEAVGNEITVLDSFYGDYFSLSEYIRANIIEGITKLILEIEVVDNDDVINGIHELRQVVEDIQVIIITSGLPGDICLGEIFNNGIYDILASRESELSQELKTVLLNRRTYWDSVRYKIDKQPMETNDTVKRKNSKPRLLPELDLESDLQEDLEPGPEPGMEPEPKTGVKPVLEPKPEPRPKTTSGLGGVRSNKPVMEEKDLVPGITMFWGMTVGFTGSQERVGTTHICISAAFYLASQGFKVACLENSCQSNPAFLKIKNNSKNTAINDKCFRLSNIDFFSINNLREGLPQVQKGNYNFILIDFGSFTDGIYVELMQCIRQVFICCTKPWEINNIDRIFQSLQPGELEESDFMFNFTDPGQHGSLEDGMDGLTIYFVDYNPDPFNPGGGEVFGRLFKRFPGQVGGKEQGTSLGRFSSWIRGTVGNAVNSGKK